MRYLGEVAD